AKISPRRRGCRATASRGMKTAYWRGSAIADRATKCGVGLITFVRYCSQTGMLSMGVVPPDSSIMTSNTGIAIGCDGAEKNAKGRRREDIKARSRRETAIRRGSCGHGETRPLRGSLRHRSSGNRAGTRALSLLLTCSRYIISDHADAAE